MGKKSVHQIKHYTPGYIKYSKTTKNPNNPVNKWATEMSRHFTKIYNPSINT